MCLLLNKNESHDSPAQSETNNIIWYRYNLIILFILIGTWSSPSPPPLRLTSSFGTTKQRNCIPASPSTRSKCSRCPSLPTTNFWCHLAARMMVVWWSGTYRRKRLCAVPLQLSPVLVLRSVWRMPIMMTTNLSQVESKFFNHFYICENWKCSIKLISSALLKWNIFIFHLLKIFLPHKHSLFV